VFKRFVENGGPAERDPAGSARPGQDARAASRAHAVRAPELREEADTGHERAWFVQHGDEPVD
jgi:hypothetical protein